MSRQARLVLVLVAIAIVAVVALATVARQYSRFAEPTRSIEDLPQHLSNATMPDFGPDGGARPEDPVVPGEAEAVPLPVDLAGSETAGDAALADADPEILAQWPGFVAGREAVRLWIDENPGPARDLTDEATGYELGRERINMHTFKVMQIRVKRGKAAIDAGLDEDAYFEVREQYRLWKDGGEADPAWAAWFEGDPERAAAVDLGKYEPLDF